MNALDAFLDWCEQADCSSRRPARRATCCSSSSRASTRHPLPASYTVNGVTPRRDAHARPARDRGAVDALRPSRGWPILADALAAGGAHEARARRCSQLSDQYLRRATRRDVARRWSRPTRSSAASTARRRRRRARPPSSPTSPRSRPSSRRGAAPGRPPSASGMPKPAKGDKLGDVQVQRRAADPGGRHHRRPGNAVRGRADDRRRASPARSCSRSTAPSTPPTAAAISTCIDDAVDTYLVDRHVARRGRPLRARLTLVSCSKRPVPSNSNCRRPTQDLADDVVGRLPLEVEAHGDPLAAVARRRLGLVVEPHAERLEPEAPVLARGLADELGPQALGAHDQLRAARQRHVVVVHHARHRRRADVHARRRRSPRRRRRGSSAGANPRCRRRRRTPATTPCPRALAPGRDRACAPRRARRRAPRW